MNELDNFSSSSGINVMIINTQAFASSLVEILKVYPKLVDEYLIQVTQPAKYRYRKYEHYMDRLRSIWKENDYINKIDYIVI